MQVKGNQIIGISPDLRMLSIHIISLGISSDNPFSLFIINEDAYDCSLVLDLINYYPKLVHPKQDILCE